MSSSHLYFSAYGHCWSFFTETIKEALKKKKGNSRDKCHLNVSFLLKAKQEGFCTWLIMTTMEMMMMKMMVKVVQVHGNQFK